MADPVSIGAFVAWALGLAGEAIVKGAVSEAVKDAYKALKSSVSRWAAGDATELEKTPDSKTRQAVIAEKVDGLSSADQESLRALAEALVGKLKQEPHAIGLDVGRLTALEAQLGSITVTQGIGARIQEADLSGTFRTGDISVGTPPGKQ